MTHAAPKPNSRDSVNIPGSKKRGGGVVAGTQEDRPVSGRPP